VIAEDYALTRIGIEPQKDTLTAILKKWRPDWTEETPGMVEFSNVKASYMLAFLEMVQKEYGGMEGYVRGKLGFTEEDIAKIRGHLVAE
jgi:hypothetical protein